MGRGGRKKKTPTVVLESKPLACLICYCRTDDSNSSVYYGFVFDPTADSRDGDGDGEGFTPVSPRFRLDGLNGVQFCIANSILYVFEMCGLSNDFPKSVYSVDLSLVLNESSSMEMLVVEKAMLEKCSEMKSPKARANAILTPKGKILVFSPHTSPIGYRDEFDFELFDPDTNLCRSLPQLPLTKRLWIRGYGFLGDSLFMISTDRGKFALDLDGNGGWEEYSRYPHTPSSYFMASGNEIYSIAGVVTIQDRHATPLARFDPPLSELPYSISCRFGPDQFDNYTSSICLLAGAADKELILSIAQAAFVDDERNDRPFILFDVYRSDSDLTRKKKASFRFTADIPGHLFIFTLEGLFRVV